MSKRCLHILLPSRAACCTVVVLMIAVNATAGVLSLGSNVSVAIIRSDIRGSGTLATVGAPASPLTYQPGLALAFADTSHVNKLGLDMGFLMVDEGGDRIDWTVGMLEYERELGHCWQNWFANIGAGCFRESSAERASNSAIVGVGIGIHRVTRERHGELRAELHASRIAADRRVGRPPLTSVGLRLGFELWL